jgi:hypothetical protein
MGNSSSSTAALAAANNTLGIGFSGSGFLIFYFTGVLGRSIRQGVIACAGWGRGLLLLSASQCSALTANATVAHRL